MMKNETQTVQSPASLVSPIWTFLRRQDMLRRTIINNNSNGSCLILSLVRPFVLLRLAIVVSVCRW